MRIDMSEAGAPTRVLLTGGAAQDTAMIVGMLRDAWPQGLLVVQAAQLTDALAELADHPDCCVVLDLVGDDLAPLRALVAAAPDAAVVALSDLGEDAIGVDAVTAGAQDCLTRSGLTPALLARAVRYARERKRTEQHLTRQALEDPLTGLPNRVLFLDRLSGALDRSRRTGRPPGVMFLDVDSFKAVNDTLGHAAGDMLLRTLATRFGTLLRPMDTVARLGGDEFTFLFEGLEGPEEALQIARRIAVSAARPMGLGADGAERSVAVSIGVELIDDPSVRLEDALRGADAAMYRAKRLGGGRAELFAAPEGTAATEPPVLDARREAPAPEPVPAVPDAVGDDDDGDELDALREGFARGELRVHYQPRVSIDGRTGLVGFEALVRWAHPTRGLLCADEFLGAALDDDLVLAIGEWVIGEALSHVRRWRQTRPGMTISVNLSRRQLEDPTLARRIRARLGESRIDPGALWLEIGVAELDELGPQLARNLDELRRLEVGIALDGVATGTDLPRLTALPVAMLKLARGVIAGLGAGEDGELVRAVVHRGHELGVSVVAAGVESDLQLARVRDLGCDGAQGHLFSRPVPEDAVAELLGGR